MDAKTVVGKLKHGDQFTAVSVGDLVTGTDQLGRYIFGRVIGTHPYYPSVTVYGSTVGAIMVAESGRWDIHLSEILSHTAAPESARLNAPAF